LQSALASPEVATKATIAAKNGFAVIVFPIWLSYERYLAKVPSISLWLWSSFDLGLWTFGLWSFGLGVARFWWFGRLAIILF
jgi:hypothetical protein